MLASVENTLREGIANLMNLYRPSFSRKGKQLHQFPVPRWQDTQQYGSHLALPAHFDGVNQK